MRRAIRGRRCIINPMKLNSISKIPLVVFGAFLLLPLSSGAAENLKINPHLNYNSDSQDGPLITGEHLKDGPVRGKPNYDFMYGEG